MKKSNKKEFAGGKLKPIKNLFYKYIIPQKLEFVNSFIIEKDVSEVTHA